MTRAHLLILLAVAACREPAVETVAPARRVPVELVPVAHQRFASPVRSSGRLAAKREMKLAFKVGGVIGQIRVDEGQRVRNGALLARLAQAEIQAQAEMARSALDKARRDGARASRLYADRVATHEDLQNAETAVEVAAARLKIARFNLRHASIRAPARGVVLRRLAEPGELIAPGHPVLVLGVDSDDWVVRVGITDCDVVRLRLGDPARVTLDAYPGETLGARVTEIAAASDPLSGTFEVEVRLDRGDARLLSGLLASVEITPDDARMVTAVPFAALREPRGDRAFVFVPSDDRRRARRLTVEVAELAEETALIRSGLGGVTQVVRDGAAYLDDGSPIRVVSGPRASAE